MNHDYHDANPIDRLFRVDFIESARQKNMEQMLEDFDSERWGIAVGKMQLQIVYGNKNAAIVILKEFMRQPLIEPIGMQSHVGEVFSKRIANMLEFAGLFDIQSVHDSSDAMLLTIKEFGMNSLKIVRAKVAEIRKKGGGGGN